MFIINIYWNVVIIILKNILKEDMEFIYFPNHLRGIIPRMVIGHLDHKDAVKDTPVTIKDFFANKEKYGRFGQAPVMKNTETGEMMGQQNAILRYLAKTYNAKDGSSFYPGTKDPMLTLQIDQWVDTQDEWFLAIRTHTVPFLDAYKNGKDDEFVKFICDYLPARLEKIENHLKKNKTKFLCSDKVTLADFAIGAHLVKTAWNPKYDQEHIVLAVLAKYPLTHAWAEHFKNYVKDWWATEGNNWEVAY
jgi:glutathione S-transferase